MGEVYLSDIFFRADIFPFVFRCYFPVEPTLTHKIPTFYPWIFVILCL